MARSEVETKIDELLREDSPMILKSVEAINHNPHPYVIGVRHIKHASDHHGGMLGDATLEAIPCAHPKCGLMYKDHHHDTVACMQWTRNCTEEEIQDELKYLVDNMNPSDIDGFVFVESDFKLS